jgi:acetyl esterase/lipase
VNIRLISRRVIRGTAILIAFLIFATRLPAQQPAPVPQQISSPILDHIDRNVIFGMYSGLALLMDVYRPAKPNGFGAIYIEGSGWTSSLNYGAPPLKNLAGLSGYVRILVEGGYTVFKIDHRATPRFHYPAQIEDAQRAVRYIRFHAKDYGIDPARIAAVGYSSGAHLASLLGLLDGAGTSTDRDPVNHESARVQCVIAGGTPASLIPFPGYTNQEGDNFLSWLIGETVHGEVPPGTPVFDKLTEASPLHYVKEGAAPFLLIHGDADSLVPYGNVVALQQALEKANVPVKVVTVRGGTHTSVITEHLPEYGPELIPWLDKYLRNVASK